MPQQPVVSPSDSGNSHIAINKRAAPPPPISVDRPLAHNAPPVAPSPSRQNDSSSWMKMLSSTFLGDHGGGLSLSASLFTRKSSALTDSESPSSSGNAAQAKRRSKHALDDTPTFKIALVGGSGVGKTSILRRWLQRPYSSKYSPTIGVDVICVPFRYKTHEVLLSIWDVSSVEVDNTQSALHSLLCENLDGLFFVCNVHRVSSIAAIDKWRHSLAKYISAQELPFYLLAHKADLIQKRIISSDDIASYAKAAGYRGWIWTVGRPHFGENEKNPAVLEALERMVDAIWKERERRPRVVTRPAGIFDSRTKTRPLEVIQVDADVHRFSASLLRIPTKAITTLPRGEDLQPIEERFDERISLTATRTSDVEVEEDDATRRSSFGGNWMLGNEKGMYLRVTDDSVVADHEESDEEEEEEEKQNAETTTHEGSEKYVDDKGENDGTEEPSEPAVVASPRVCDAVKPLETETEIESLAVTKAPTSGMTDHDAWRFFAGSINRARAEEILSGREDGTFLLRRKDAQTLILSYVGRTQLHHALIEYKNQQYHVGSAKSSQAAFPTLSRCLRSVRKYANRGLIFTRNTAFRVVNKEAMALAEEIETTDPPKLHVTTTSATTAWRPGSTHGTPTTTALKPGVSSKRRESSGLLAHQGHVRVPPKNRIDELSASFYEQLTERLHAYATTQQQKERTPESDESQGGYGGYGGVVDTTAMLDMANEELKQLQSMAAGDAERQWRQLVKNMELWNRIVLNLVPCDVSLKPFMISSGPMHDARRGASPKDHLTDGRWRSLSSSSPLSPMEATHLLGPAPLSPTVWTMHGGPADAHTPLGKANALRSSPTNTNPNANNTNVGVMPTTFYSPSSEGTPAQEENDDMDVDGLELGRKKLVVSIKRTDRRGSGASSNGKRRSGAMLLSLSPARVSGGETTPTRLPPPVSSSDASSTARDKLTILAVVVHLCKGNIGPGAMSLPSGFSKTGIHAAPIYFVLIALLSTYNMDLLLYCKRMVSPTRPMSFGEVAGKILGPRGKVLVDVFLVGTQLGICCVYFTFIATNLHVVLPEDLQVVIHERQLIFAIFPVILLLSWIRTLHSITPYSSLANVAVTLGIGIVFYYSIDYYYHPTTPRQAPITVDYTQFPAFYGTAVYSFEGIGLILPIQNEMQQPHLFPRVLAACMLVILVLFLFIGQVPTLAFGRITNGSMTAVLHEYCDGWLVTMANVMLAFACLLSFPIQFYPAVSVLEKAMATRRSSTRSRNPLSSRPLSNRSTGQAPSRRESMSRLIEAAGNRRRASVTSEGMSRSLAVSMAAAKSSRRPSVVSASATSPARVSGPQASTGLPRWLETMMCSLSQSECNRTIFRSMLCTALMAVAVCIPDISLLISLFGAVGSSMLAIIVPPVLYLKLHSQHAPLSLLSRLLHYGIAGVGVVGMIAGTLQALKDIVASFQSP